MDELLKTQIKDLYEQVFFKDGFADRTTGIVTGTDKKIATYPYIGDKYGKSKRILIVGLDIGEDETPNEIQSFEYRNQCWKTLFKENGELADFNQHRAGTYFTALYFLRNYEKFESLFNIISNEDNVFISLIKKYSKEIIKSENPLDYIVQTNFYKYVNNKREGRTGNLDRIHIDFDREIELFLSEIKLFNPDIVFLQSTTFNYNKVLNKEIKKELINQGIELYIGYHPSVKQHEIKKAKNYFNLEKGFIKRLTLDNI